MNVPLERLVELLKSAQLFALTVRVNTMNGPDPDADWDHIYEWADDLEHDLKEALP